MSIKKIPPPPASIRCKFFVHFSSDRFHTILNNR